MGRGYVQIVGAPCAHCDQRVVSLDDGAACADCGAVVHVDEACWQAHWEAGHAGAITYRGAMKAPAPVKQRAPGDIDAIRHVPGGAESLLCTACRRRVWAPTTTSSIGFRQFSCPDCLVTVFHPLTGARQTMYLVVLLVSVATTIFSFSQGGQITVPAAFVILSAVALFKNHGIKQQLERAEMSEPSFDELPVRKKIKKKKTKRPELTG
jgi:hypothetical protein